MVRFVMAASTLRCVSGSVVVGRFLHRSNAFSGVYGSSSGNSWYLLARESIAVKLGLTALGLSFGLKRWE
jgi:hypothetical protein